MTNNSTNQYRSLADVLRLINEGLTDFLDQPAKTAFDKGSSGDYPLHKIAIWGDIGAAAVLLANGADINARGEDDDTPLHRAVAGGKAEMVDFLISQGADTHLKNRYGDTPLDHAIDPEIKKVFQRGGSDRT